MEEEDQEVTAYEMTITETDELQLRIAVGEKEIICHMKVNQAFSFITLFIVTLGRLVTTEFVDGDLGIFLGKKGSGGDDPPGGAASFH